MASLSSLFLSLAAATLVTQCHAFWREVCSVVQTGRIDPILSPDQVSGHVHKFAGGSSKLPEPRPGSALVEPNR
jgi:hypothetical protein